MLVVAKRLYLKKTQIDEKHIDIKRKYKKEMEGVNDNFRAFVH